MGVDGIGSGGRPIPGAGPAELERAPEVEGAAGPEGSSGPSRASGSALLEQLGRGEIDLDRYLDAQVSAAVSHVQGALSASQLDFIRETLREQMASDPVLVELVRRATGGTPKPRAD